MLHRLAAPHNSLFNTATSVPPPPVIGSKEEHLDNLHAYNESPADTSYKAVTAKPV